MRNLKLLANLRHISAVRRGWRPQQLVRRFVLEATSFFARASTPALVGQIRMWERRSLSTAPVHKSSSPGIEASPRNSA